MYRIATALRVVLTGGITGIILLAASAVSRFSESEATMLTIVVSIIVAIFTYALIRAERIVDTHRTNTLNRRLDALMKRHDFVDFRLEQVVTAVGYDLTPQTIRVEATFNELVSAYLTRRKYESSNRRKWLFLLGIRKSFALFRPQEELGEAERKELVEWFRSKPKL